MTARPRSFVRRRSFWLILLALLVLATPWLAWNVAHWSYKQAYQGLAQESRDRLALYGGNLHSEIEKYRNLPRVLASDPDVVGLLSDETPQPSRADQLSRRLEALNTSLMASAVYVLDSQGMTLAASNWREHPGSFVGQRFDYRQYFQDAMQGREGHYFAMGTTSNQPGYYIAVPVRREDDGTLMGAVVVKLSLDTLEQGWAGGGEKVLVSDQRGVVFISNMPEWHFRTLGVLSEQERQEIRNSRQYGDAPLLPLGLVQGADVVTLDRHGYVQATQELPDEQGWQLTVLSPAEEAEVRARSAVTMVLAGAGVTGFLLYALAQRSLRRRRLTRELERRVAERTAALTQANDDLRAKQSELVQAAKLAALGQMSAGMAHEINQPLAAIRSFADNAVTLMGLGRLEEVAGNLDEIADLTDRLGRITGQLKQFARKSRNELVPVSLRRAVDASLALLSGRLEGQGAELHWSPPDDPLWVLAEDVRLQQVLVNLLRNGLDAMRLSGGRRLSINLEIGLSDFFLSIHDSGPGLSEQALAQLFEPFFTTKPAGEGLGLGLSISEGIIRDFGGRLSGSNHPEGGAVFTLALPRSSRGDSIE